MIKYIGIGILLLGMCGCSTTAMRSNGETLEIRGIGKAEWPDGAKIEGKPMIEFPALPSTIIGK